MSVKYFHGYWQATKIILSKIFNNEIIPDKDFPDYGILGILYQGQ